MEEYLAQKVIKKEITYAKAIFKNFDKKKEIDNYLKIKGYSHLIIK